MRVVHFTRTFLHRTETFIYTQLTHLPPEKAFVLACEAQNQERFPGIDYRAFSMQPESWQKRWSRFNYRHLRRLTSYERQYYFQQLQSLQPDIIHAHFAVDAAYIIDLCQQTKHPLVVSCYGYDISSFPHKYLGWGGRYLQQVWRNADCVLAMSNDMRSDLLSLGCPDKKIRTHYHGINLTRFTYSERTNGNAHLRLLFAGSLANRKGVEDALRAYAQLSDRYPQLEMRILGAGYLRPKLDQLVSEWGLVSRVTFGGFVPHENVQDELSNAHIFCHPSWTLENGDKEGIPGTIVEAMASGLPIVSTRHAGIPEMVRDGEDGLLVAERDIDGIAGAISTLVDNPNLRSQMGRNAALHARQKADAVLLTKELEAIYQEVMDAENTRHPI